MKKIIPAAILILLLTFSPGHARTLTHPPIPKESPHAEKIAIILLKEKASEQEIKKLLNKHPNIELRYIFEHTINGFSVKGDSRSLEELSKGREVSLVSPVKTYKVESGKNIKLIGGDVVRRFYDDKDRRLTGKGVTVGVIDTGIDYNHPDLRRSYGGGHDLVDGDLDPMETKASNWQRTLHGTHVSGIIAANGKIQGVAPEATIIAYRALGPGGAGTTEQVIAAIEQAIKDKVDILNLSLGNSVNGPDLPISLALNKAVDNGITAVTSSGNSGPNTWTVGSPGTASKAISVGASTPPQKIPYVDLGGVTERLKLEPMQGSDDWKIGRAKEIVSGNLGELKDLKNTAGKIVLLERGKLTFAEKARNALKTGAAAVIVYNNTNGSFIGNLEESIPIPTASLSKKDGEKMKKMLEKGKLFCKVILIEEKDTLAPFSSRGPVTGTWEIKPDVVAPGVAIQSTIPGGYLSLQGTSMAAPHVAGACALIKQAHPDWGPAQIKSALMNTAKQLFNERGYPYRTFEQGAGRIQLDQAVEAKTLVLPGSLQFGKFELSDKRHKHEAVLEVENVGTSTNSYSFRVPKRTPGIQWELPQKFQVKPKEMKKVVIKMSANPSVLKKKLHDGELFLNEGTSQIRIPFIYVLEEPNYPRIMGFDFVKGDRENSYRYEVYLPGGAEEFGIALFQPDDYRFIGFLDWERDVGKGLLQKEVKQDRLPKEGVYIVKVFAKKAGKEDMVDAIIEILPAEKVKRWGRERAEKKAR